MTINNTRYINQPPRRLSVHQFNGVRLFFILFFFASDLRHGVVHGFRLFPVVRPITSITCSSSIPRNEQLPTKKTNKKRRVDELLIERQQAANKDEVEKMIMSGNVILNDNGEIITSSALKVDVNREIRIRMRKNEPFVSRAG